MIPTQKQLKARRIKAGDSPAVERGLELAGYERDHTVAEDTRGGRPGVRVELWRKAITDEALPKDGRALLLVHDTQEDTFELFQQVAVGKFFDGDWAEAEVIC